MGILSRFRKTPKKKLPSYGAIVAKPSEKSQFKNSKIRVEIPATGEVKQANSNVFRSSGGSSGRSSSSGRTSPTTSALQNQIKRNTTIQTQNQARKTQEAIALQNRKIIASQQGLNQTQFLRKEAIRKQQIINSNNVTSQNRNNTIRQPVKKLQKNDGKNILTFPAHIIRELKKELKETEAERDVRLERRRIINEAVRQDFKRKNLKQLINEGRLPEAVVKAFNLAGRKLLGFSDTLKVKTIGGKKLNDKEIAYGGRILGEFGLFAGLSPVTATTGEVIAKLPSNTFVKFIGKQRQSGNKIVTDVAFSSGGRRFGFARGVSVSKGNEAFTLSMGRTGVRSRLRPTKFVKRSSFISTERSGTIPKVFTESLEIGSVQVAKRNIKGLLQIGGGRIYQVRGDKILRFGRKKIPMKSINLDEFISVSSVFTAKDISKITGRTITKKGDIVNFIGLITGKNNIGSSTFKVTGSQKALYQKALEQVISTASASVKTSTTRGLSAGAKSIIASKVLTNPNIKTTITGNTVRVTSVRLPKPTTTAPPTLRSKNINTLVTQTNKETSVIKQLEQSIGNFGNIQLGQIRGSNIGKINSGIKQLTPSIKMLDNQILKIKQEAKIKLKGKIKGKLKTRLRQRLKLKLKQKLKQKLKTQQRLRQRLKLKLKLSLKLKQKLKQKGRFGGKAKPTPKGKKKPIIPLVIPKGFTKKTMRKSVPVYYVKEKVRGKIKNLTPRPLTLREAKDFLAYRLDNRLSRTGYFEPLGKSKIVVSLPPKMKGYFGRNSRKLRPYKIRVGKKKAIRRGYIEKRKFAFDKPGERRKKTTIKRKSMRRTTIKKKIPVRRVKKRRMSPLQRRVMLKNLKRARSMRKR